MNFMWEVQVRAIQNPSVQCWVCGQMGHMGRNCPSKGKGNGSVPVGKGAGFPTNPTGGKGAGGITPGVGWIPGNGVPGVKGGGLPGFKGKGVPVGPKGYGKGFPWSPDNGKGGFQG
eukprot:8070837-Karenia_brevis.AAC.1